MFDICAWFVLLMCSKGGGRGPPGPHTLVYTHTATHGDFEMALYTVVYRDVILWWVCNLV